MEITRPKIKFYEKRKFSDKMSATFDFVRINIKPILKLCLYIILPLSLIQGIFTNSYVNLSISGDYLANTSGILGKSMIFLLFAAITGFAIISIALTSLQVYNEKGTLEGITISDMKDKLIKNGFRSLGISMIIGLLLVAYIFAISMVSAFIPLFIFIGILGVIVLMVPIILMYPIYIFEDTSVGTAISKAFRLGFKTWGSLFALVFVVGILVSIVQGIGSLPWSILFVVKALLSPGDALFFGESVIMYIASVFMLFVSYSASIIIYIAVSYHYSSASEDVEGTSINDDLEIFDQL